MSTMISTIISTIISSQISKDTLRYLWICGPISVLVVGLSSSLALALLGSLPLAQRKNRQWTIQRKNITSLLSGIPTHQHPQTYQWTAFPLFSTTFDIIGRLTSFSRSTTRGSTLGLIVQAGLHVTGLSS